MEATLDKDLLVVVLLDGLSEDYRDVQAALDAQSKYPEVDVVCARLLEVSDRKKDGHGQQSTALYTKGKFKPRKPPNNNKKGSTFPYICRVCGIKGHMAKDCYHNKEKAKTVQSSTTEGAEYGFVITEESAFSVSTDDITWCLDSGATSHMCSTKSLFDSLEMCTKESFVTLANGQRVKIAGIGTALLPSYLNNVGKDIKLFRTLYIPDLNENLISVSKAASSKVKVVFEGDKAKIYSKTGTLLFTADQSRGLYIVSRSDRVLATRESNNSLNLWHRRMGHLNITSLKQLQSAGMVTGLPEVFKSDASSCVSCICAKQCVKPFSVSENKRTKRKLELVHSDLCGPMRTASLSKAVYFITFIDDYSRRIFVYFMQKKSEALDKFKAFSVCRKTNRGINQID